MSSNSALVKPALVKAVANATNATFIRLIGSELVQKYIGEGARLVRELFQLAQEKAPSIIFIDELDAVGAKRMDVGTTGDREVQRTKGRPIAAGKISIKKSFSYVVSLCALAFLILIQFNLLTIILGLGSMILAFSYPFMKRITYWPQLFLGLTFNWGIIMAWAAVNNNISYEIIALYISAIFWTLGYDTIYGVQDMEDDEIIGVKSTSIKFKKNIKFFVSASYFLTSLILVYLFEDMLKLNIFTILLMLFILSLIYQIKRFNKKKAEDCLNAFKFNNISGLILFLSICSINL